MGKVVGILSMQKVINYGSYLQAYALKQMLIDCGAESVSFIDIVPGCQLPGYETHGTKYIMKRLQALWIVICQGRIFSKRRTLDFMKQVAATIRSTWGYLGISSYPQLDETYDIAVIGSDEVFHCCQSTSWGYTKQLYGDIPTANRIYSYAASFGATSLNDIKSLGIDQEISSELKKLSSISVRDENSRNIVEAITGIRPHLHIDPVLAYGYKKELANVLPVDESGYVLVYSYPDRINDKQEIYAIKKIAKEKGKRLISVMSRYDWCDRAIIPTPLELLSWVKNADYVISETFHGTIFAIIAHRQFVTISRKSSLPKLTSMLMPYGLSDRLLLSADNMGHILDTKIDYSVVESKLEELRQESISFLKQMFS